MVALGFDLAESMETLGVWQDENDIPFPFATGPAEIIVEYNVLTRSTKIGIGPDGVIVFREGYGQADEETWRERLAAMRDE